MKFLTAIVAAAVLNAPALAAPVEADVVSLDERAPVSFNCSLRGS